MYVVAQPVDGFIYPDDFMACPLKNQGLGKSLPIVCAEAKPEKEVGFTGVGRIDG